MNPYKKMYALTEEQYKQYKRMFGDSTTYAPTDSFVAPNGSSEAPSGSSVAPYGSSLAPTGSSVAPTGSSVAPADSLVTPTSSLVAHKRVNRKRRAPSSIVTPTVVEEPPPPPNYMCKTCSHKFKHKRNLARHMKIHTNKPKYPNWLTL